VSESPPNQNSDERAHLVSKPTRFIAALALVLAGVLAFAGTASAQESPTYTGVSPTTITQGPGGESQAPAAAPAAAQAAQATQASGALPYTGSDSLPLAQIGVALLAVGAVATIAVRKRNATNA
jgi:LPXTG-motif cell wall-anchored protein